MSTILKVQFRRSDGKLGHIGDYEAKEILSHTTLDSFIEKRLARNYGSGEYIFKVLDDKGNEIMTESRFHPKKEEQPGIELTDPDELHPFFLIAENGPFDRSGNAAKIGRFNFDSIAEADASARKLWKNGPLHRPDRLLIGKVIRNYPVKEWAEKERIEAQLEEHKTMISKSVEALKRKDVLLGEAGKHIEVLELELASRDRSEKKKKELNEPIINLELSVRAEKCLNNVRIKTIGDLVQKSAADLFRVKDLGRKTLKEIEGLLACRGLVLAGLAPVTALRTTFITKREAAKILKCRQWRVDLLERQGLLKRVNKKGERPLYNEKQVRELSTKD